VTVPARLAEPARALVPPGATLHPDGERAAEVRVDDRDGALHVSTDGEPVASTADADLALGMLDAQIRAQIALLAPEYIFVHAGVVAVEGRAAVLPGFTFAGKTTLTRALLEAGAVYYSDEFAVIDAAGRVHPYPKPLSIRHEGGHGQTTETPAARLGAQVGREPVRIGLIAVITFRPGATLDPQPIGLGPALLALLGHTIPARTRPAQSLGALKAAVQGARAWKGERGEAGAAAQAIIAQMSV
jgi:hypothetical protein